jgi:hypothetical protein
VPLTVVLSPVFLRWGETAMVDIPIATFGIIPALCAVAALVAKRDLRWPAVFCAGFLIGMKLSLIAFAPLAIGTVWLLIRALGGSRRACVTACVVLIVTASPWYVRNLILDHDPIPPLMSLMRHRPDAAYSVNDTRLILADLKTDRSLRALVRLPYETWAKPGTLREYGAEGLNLFLYVPFIAIFAAMLLGTGGRRERALLVLCATSAYGLCYCILTSYLLRYMLVVEPPLAASIGALLLWLPRVPSWAMARILIALLTITPTPSLQTLKFYQERWERGYRYFESSYVSDSAFLGRDLPGYKETQRVIASPTFAHRPAPRVLLIRVETEYYFRRVGIETVGDWFGPGRYADFQAALENDRLSDYLRHFHIGAIIYDRRTPILDSSQDRALVLGLAKLGFHFLKDDPHGYLVAIH